MEKAGFTAVKSLRVDAPVIEELPLTLECTLAGIDDDTGCVLGKIVNIVADENVLGDDGNVDLNKLNPIAFDPASRCYFTMGKKVGKAFSDGTKLK